MITNFLLYTIFFIIEGLILLLPTGFSLPSQISDAFTYVFSALGQIPFLPSASSLSLLITTAFAWTAGMLLWNLFGWLLKKIPGVS